MTEARFSAVTRRHLGAALAACVGMFAALAILVTTGRAGGLDAQAHAALYALVGPARLGAVQAVTWLGNHDTITGAVVAVSLVLLVLRKPWLTARVVAASGGGGFVSYGLKALFGRARPTEQVVAATGLSFPSGHATAAAVFYGMMIFLTWHLATRAPLRRGASALLVAVILAVGLSRVYLNVHYLSDVIAGWAAGTAWLLAVLLSADALERKRSAPR